MKNRIAALFVAAFVGIAATFAQAVETYIISDKHDALQEAHKSDGEIAIGDAIRAFRFQTLDGTERELTGPTAFVFMSTVCPVSNRYVMRLNRLYDEFGPQGVAIYGVSSNADETDDDVRRHAAESGHRFPLIKDADGSIARRLGASMTPQAFVLDDFGVLRYRGPIDDNRYETRVENTYMRDALAALLNGEDVPIAESFAFGCTIHLPSAAEAGSVTYAEQIAPIMQARCQDCHRPGEVAPFSLLSYGDAKRWAAEIVYYTEARLMPPWKLEPGYGEFKNSRRMSDDEIALIRQWVEGGTPLGDLSKAPKPKSFPTGWKLGEPDVVVEMEREYEIAAEGEDEYRHFVLPTRFNRDRYVAAVDIEPGNRQTVHHVIIYLDMNGEARKLDAAAEGYGYSTSGGGAGFDVSGSLGGWAPGTSPAVLPEGSGYLLPAGADIVLQVHYYKTGKVERDRSRAALYFTDASNPIAAHIDDAINTEFVIPAGAKRHPVEGREEIEEDVYVFAVMPHMHLLGQDMRAVARTPEGETLDLFYVADWDFNWQDVYHYKNPVFLPKGSTVEFVAHFDNSADNPHNPHSPPIPVGWGEKTTDEMAIAFFFYLNADEYRPQMSKADR